MSAPGNRIAAALAELEREAHGAAGEEIEPFRSELPAAWLGAYLTPAGARVELERDQVQLGGPHRGYRLSPLPEAWAWIAAALAELERKAHGAASARTGASFAVWLLELAPGRLQVRFHDRGAPVLSLELGRVEA